MTAPAALPAPRPWHAERPLRWGVIAPGVIAAHFVRALHRRGEHRVVAVGSRSPERARAFAAEHGIEHAHADYEALVADPEVEAVYIASPHSAHREHALLAIAAGKHVLVEKPLATTAEDAQAVLGAARAAGVLAMEAMWTRYLPQSDIIRQLLADGAIGDVRTVHADFGFAFPYDPAHRMYDPAQAGGTLLDAGVYPVSFVVSVLGPPASISASGSLAPSGVDDQAQVSLAYDGAVATATSSLRAWLPIRASIAGSTGRIEVDREFIRPSGLQVTFQADIFTTPTTLRWQDPDSAEPYDSLHWEAAAFAAFVEQGLSESPVHPHHEVVAVIDVLERAGRQIRGMHG